MTRALTVWVLLLGVWMSVPVEAQSPASARTETPAQTGPKIYRWVDAAGRVQFGSSPPPGTPIETVQVREQSLGNKIAAPDSRPAGEVRDPLVADGLDVVDRRNRSAPAPSYDWEAERPQRLAEHCGFIRDRVKELRAGQEWIVLDWGKPPTRLDGPRRVEELVRRERQLKQYCEGS